MLPDAAPADAAARKTTPVALLNVWSRRPSVQKKIATGVWLRPWVTCCVVGAAPVVFVKLPTTDVDCAKAAGLVAARNAAPATTRSHTRPLRLNLSRPRRGTDFMAVIIRHDWTIYDSEVQ